MLVVTDQLMGSSLEPFRHLPHTHDEPQVLLIFHKLLAFCSNMGLFFPGTMFILTLNDKEIHWIRRISELGIQVLKEFLKCLPKDQDYILEGG